MHILMTVNAAWNIWNFRIPVVQVLLAQGHNVTILAPYDDSVDHLESLGCRCIPLEMNAKGVNPIEGLQLVRQFRRIWAAEKPDIVLSYTIKNNLFGAMAARSFGVPFLPNVSGLGTAFLSGGALEMIAVHLYRRAFRELETVFFQNEDDRKLFVDRDLVRLTQTRVLPGSGIDLARFHAVDYSSADEPPVFLMIARLLRDKGVVEFVDAARQVKAGPHDARFQLLGATGSENRTAISAETVQEWGEEGIVEYLGTERDVRPAIAAASCVVLPSYREGAPRTLIEAAAMARPVIATDVPGCRSVVDHKETGFLCKVQDADSLAVAIKRFLEMPHEARAAMGKAGRKKMEREYDEKFVVEAYLEEIERLTGCKP